MRKYFFICVVTIIVVGYAEAQETWGQFEHRVHLVADRTDALFDTTMHNWDVLHNMSNEQLAIALGRILGASGWLAVSWDSLLMQFGRSRSQQWRTNIQHQSDYNYARAQFVRNNIRSILPSRYQEMALQQSVRTRNELAVLRTSRP